MKPYTTVTLRIEEAGRKKGRDESMELRYTSKKNSVWRMSMAFMLMMLRHYDGESGKGRKKTWMEPKPWMKEASPDKAGWKEPAGYDADCADISGNIKKSEDEKEDGKWQGQQ